ncbi:MAG: helix-turn-helix transcriptional regulator [Clostridiales bacterium]|jgi:transcriptional regulator with XRE-family HTH domain|nr:helix-turn-helix transcriptional regulator [Clostridiales bacterium]
MKKMLGGFIRELRKEKGLSQDELGYFAGVTNKAVSKWETDEANPDIQIVPKLAAALGVTADELLNCKRADANNSGARLEVKNEIDNAEKKTFSGMENGRENMRENAFFQGENGTKNGGIDPPENGYENYEKSGANGEENTRKISGKTENAEEERYRGFAWDFEFLKSNPNFERLAARNYVSKKRTKNGKPYIHINFNSPSSKADGVAAAGFRAKGIFALGLIANGVFSVGILSFGAVSSGVFSFGLLLAFGSIAGALGAAFGAVAAGFAAFGAVAVGFVSYGAVAVGYFAHTADEGIAIGVYEYYHGNGRRIGARLIFYIFQIIDGYFFKP